MKVEFEQMVKEQDSYEEARQTRRNLEVTHMKIWENVKRKMAKYIETLLEVPSEDKCQCWFALTIEPRHVNEFTDVGKLHEIDTVDTRTTINGIMPKIYDHILAEELVENPYKAPPAVTIANSYLYLNEENVG